MITQSRLLGSAHSSGQEEFLQRLLQPDPGRRYQRPQAVQDDLDKIQHDTETILGLSDSLVRPHSPGFVLHRAQLARLSQCEPGLILVRGPSGIGKSRMLDEFARRRPWQRCCLATPFVASP